MFSPQQVCAAEPTSCIECKSWFHLCCEPRRVTACSSAGSVITAGALIIDDVQCGLSSAMASSQSEFFILLRDEFANVLTTGIDTSRVSVRVEKGGIVLGHDLVPSFCRCDALTCATGEF
jgi:hypothetical protein